ncbi:MAG: hypothetical protein AAFV53_41055 [Myxococcota bacterium]
MSQPSGPPAKPGVKPQFYAGGERPDLSELLSETMNEFTENLSSYAMAGLGQMLILFPVILITIFGLYIALGLGVVGMIVGGAGLAAVLPEDLVALGAVLGPFIMISVIGIGSIAAIGLVTAVTAPLHASLVRAIVAHQRGEQPLEWTSAFSTLTENVSAVIFGALTLTVLSILLAMMCYLPALLPLIFLTFAPSLIAIHGHGAMDGLRLAAQHARAHLGWHATFGLIGFVMLMVASNIPVIGPMFVVAFHVRAYRRVFGDGPEPVLA